MKNIFLEKSIDEIIELIESKKINSNQLLSLSKKIYDEDGKKYKAWNSFSIDKNHTDLGIVNNILKGIPFAAKDIFNTIYFPTEMGSKLWKNYQAGNNARVVDNLICSGGHIVGKTITAEFAVHELNETLNPHDLKRTPGTSSSGSAVAVQIGNVPFALASQTAGSIIRPASFCGVWGMKPSYGLVPRTGVLKTTDTLDTIGFLTSHAKNLKIILDIIRVKGPNYPYVYKNIDKKNIFLKKFKIGFIKTNLWNYAENYIKDETLNFVDKLSKDKNILIQEIKWPKKFHDMHFVHSIIYSKSLSYYFAKEYKNSANISKIMKRLIEEGKNVSVNSFHDALQKQIWFQREVNNIFKNIDVCITYSTASEAVIRGEREIDDTCLLWTLAGIPAVNAPLNYSPSGLPFGIQFISKKWNDYAILKFIDYLVDNNFLSPYVLKKK